MKPKKAYRPLTNDDFIKVGDEFFDDEEEPPCWRKFTRKGQSRHFIGIRYGSVFAPARREVKP